MFVGLESSANSPCLYLTGRCLLCSTVNFQKGQLRLGSVLQSKRDKNFLIFSHLSLVFSSDLGRLKTDKKKHFWKQLCTLFHSIKLHFGAVRAWILKLGLATYRNQASCSMGLLRKQLRCTLPSLCSTSRFILFVVALTFKTSLRQRCTMRRNGCRESCSGVKWSVSARLKPAGGGCVPNHILLLFTCSTYCSCPHKVHNVACIVLTIGTYYSVVIVRLELWLLYPSQPLCENLRVPSWARILSKPF